MLNILFSVKKELKMLGKGVNNNSMLVDGLRGFWLIASCMPVIFAFAGICIACSRSLKGIQVQWKRRLTGMV